jgi:putative DNA primase/helicase
MTCALLSLEESADRQVARLHAAGADLDLVLILGDVEDLDDDGRAYHRPWRLPQDCGVLERFLVEHGVELVVVDGLGYSVNGDTHNYGQVGSALSSLAAVAERTGCTVLGITHPPKGGSDPVTAAIGSTAWTAVARIVWLLGLDPDDDTKQRRVVQVSKTNYKAPEVGVSFSISDNTTWEIGYVSGIGSSTVPTEALVAASVPEDERTERDEAREVVRQILAGGEMETAELIKLTRAAGLSDRTVERARRDLGVKAKPRHDGKKITGWTLELPSPPASPPHSLPGGVGGVGGVAPTRRDTYSFPESPTSKAAKSAKTQAGGLAGGVADSLDLEPL